MLCKAHLRGLENTDLDYWSAEANFATVGADLSAKVGVFVSYGRTLYTSATMRQIWITKEGQPEKLQIQDAPEPIPKNGEVRIRVQAIGVNYEDILGRLGMDKSAPEIPYVPGFEVSGIVDRVSQGVGDLKEGDAVFAYTRYGGYSDVICVPYRQVFRRFNWMSAEDAVALPMNYLAAYIMLVVMGALRTKDKVLIHQASGGLGMAALDICSILGAETFGTAVTEKHDFLYKRGLDNPIDFRRIDYEREIMTLTEQQGVQIVIDTLGGMHWPKNYRLLAPAGRLVHAGNRSLVPEGKPSWRANLRGLIMLPFYTPLKLMRDNKSVMGINMVRLWESPESQRNWMKQIIAWYDEALLRPNIDKTFRFEEAVDAHHYVQEGENVGKVVLIP